MANPIKIEESETEEEKDDANSESSSEAVARGYDPSPGSDQNERPRPGLRAHLPRDVNFDLVDPDHARPTVEEGANQIVALQAQRDHYQRSERRIRDELVEAENRVMELEQILSGTEEEGRTRRSLQRQIATQNEAIGDLNERTGRAQAERDNLLDQLDGANNGGMSLNCPLK